MTKKQTEKTVNATPLRYRLSNDYMFRAVFQSYPKALEGLCRSVLHLSPKDNVKVTLRNPVELGRNIESTEFILDLAVIVNGSLYLNLEMQMYHEPYWIERSISYTCRSFDNLNHGKKYDTVLPVVHVGFLDYDLFPKHPQFFSTYLLTDTKNRQIYSDKFRISVVNLNHTELATEEDKTFITDLWARTFKAENWEEINMLAQQNEYIKEAVSGIAVLTEDEQIRQQYQAREDFEYWERIKENGHKQELKKKEKALAEKDKALANLTEKESRYLQEIADLKTQLTALETSSKQN